MAFFIWVPALLAGCSAIPTVSERIAHADQLAASAGYASVELGSVPFPLQAYLPANSSVRGLTKNPIKGGTLRVYIEGDGAAWFSRTTASEDPTPVNPIGLKLALADTTGSAVYLARPCQYMTRLIGSACRESLWTAGRFSSDVVVSTNSAISLLKQRYQADRLVLVGYSGGGAVAALVAARRQDVTLLVTVAGNLDHQAWTKKFSYTPLTDSLNPADFSEQLKATPQIHYVGDRDTVVPAFVVQAYRARFPQGAPISIVQIPQADHSCCWPPLQFSD